jgi:hypothetical protein
MVVSAMRKILFPSLWITAPIGLLFVLAIIALVGAGVDNVLILARARADTFFPPVKAITCSTHQWINVISAGLVPSCAQPASTDLSDLVGPTAWTPVLTCTSGGPPTYTLLSAHYSKIGKDYQVTFTETLTAGNSCSGSLQVSLPNSLLANDVWEFVGRDTATADYWVGQTAAGSNLLTLSPYAASGVPSFANNGIALSGHVQSQ